MPSVPSISVEQRRARLARRHRLAGEAGVDDDVAAIADSVLALHATDPGPVDVGQEQADAVAGQAARLEEQLGALRGTPRFRTPLERELSE